MTGHDAVAQTRRQGEDRLRGVSDAGCESVKGSKPLPAWLGAGFELFIGIFMQNRDIV